MAQTTRNTENLTRELLYSNQLRELIKDELVAQKYVEWTQAPDGSGGSLQFPMIGDSQATDYKEDQAVVYTSLDTGKFIIHFDEYLQSGNYITEKLKTDSWMSSQLEAKFVPSQHRAIMSAVEDKIMKTPNEDQTAGDYNIINKSRSRWVAGGANNQLTPEDFAFARFAFKDRMIGAKNLVAIVDPSFEVHLDKLTANHLFSTSPRGESLVTTGIASDLNFVINLFGVDIYTSQRLTTGITETIDGKTVTHGAANMIFSADKSITPWIGAWIQQPKVDVEWNKDYQRTEYVTTARYGVGIQRPENMVVVLSDTNHIYS